MKNRDLIQEVINGELTGEEADEICLSINAWFHDDAPAGTAWSDDWIGASQMERTAGTVPFAVLAQWRKNGWPRECYKCKKTLEPEIFGWRPVEQDGKYFLQHVRCDDEYLKLVRKIAIERGHTKA